MISKEQVWKGLKLELTDNELCKIFQADEYEKDDYYNFDLLIGTLYKTINKEINFYYFIDWCVLIANCLDNTMNSHRTRIGKLYYDISYLFDGISFMQQYDKKALKEYVAKLKYYDYLIRKAKGQITEPFVTNGIERIMCVDHANWNYDSCVYRVIIKNYNTKEWEIRYIDNHNFDYDNNVNYCFVEEKEFCKIFYGFYKTNTKWKEVHNLKF